MHLVQKNISSRATSLRLVFKSSKKIENSYTSGKQTTSMKPGSNQKYPLFNVKDESSIIQNICGHSLANCKESRLETIESYKDKLKPTANRNWVLLQDENESFNCIRGFKNSFKHHLLSRTGAIKEVEKHIEYLEVNKKKVDTLEAEKLIKHQNEWLRASLKAAHISNQYLKKKNSSTKIFKDVEEELEHVAKTISKSLTILTNSSKELTNDDLKIVILALGFWCPIHNQSIFSMNVKNEMKMKIDNLLLSLEDTSFERILHLKLHSGKDSPEFLKYVTDRLDFAQIWTFALTGADKNDSNIKPSSFPVVYMIRATNSKLGKDMMKQYYSL